MTDLRPTPMDRAPKDPTAPLLGPGQWHCEAPVFRKGEVPPPVALIMAGNGRWPTAEAWRAPRDIGRGSMPSWIRLPARSTRACAI